MSASREYTTYITDLFSAFGEITVGRMFGGTLLKHHGKQLGIIMNDTLYFRIPEKLQAQYRKYGSKPFQYKKKTGMVIVKTYWSVPDEILEDREALIAWAEELLCQK